MNFKSLLPVVIGSAFICNTYAAEGWETNFEQAKKIALENKKDLLVEFSGSDWCPPCKKLKQEIFQNLEFNGSENFVLVELDFPQDTSKLTAELVKQNEELKKAYIVNGFPTVYLMDEKGLPYAKMVGYLPGGVVNYNKNLLELKKQKEVRDSAFKEATVLEAGKEQAKAYVKGFEGMPKVSPKLYPKELKVIETYLPDSAFLKSLNKANKGNVNRLSEEEYNKLAAVFDKKINEDKVQGGELQLVLLQKMMLDARAGKITDSKKTIELLEKIVEVDPESLIGIQTKGQLGIIKKKLKLDK